MIFTQAVILEVGPWNLEAPVCNINTLYIIQIAAT